jgi:hypothetical protein
MRNIPDNSDDVIDSRDVIARLDELEQEREDIISDRDNADTDEERVEFGNALQVWDEDNADELNALRTLAEEGEDASPDWRHGETLIRESYFTDYCQELLADIGDLPRDLPHYIVIDWEATADNLKADYSTVDFGGVDYLIRNG